MSTVLVTHAYFLAFDPKQKKLGQPYPPLGTLYAAAVLREAGFAVDFFDVQFAESPALVCRPLARRPRYFVVYDDGFNYLTKMCLTNMREAAFAMMQEAKSAGCIVIVSSSDATDHAALYLDQGADYVLVGEGEQTLKELLQRLEAGEGAETVPGLCFREADALLRTPPRKLMSDLDALPLPAWDLVDLAPYRQQWKRSAGYFSLNSTTTRGCPFKCNWCAKPIYGNRYHARSPQQVVEELAYLQRQEGFDHIWFCDDIFGLKPGWVESFAALVAERRLSFRFKIQSRADLLTDEACVAALAKAGCEQIWMGVESGSQRILDAMDKGITLDQVRRANALIRRYGMKPCFFIQFGYLGETRADIQLTIDLIRELLPHQIGISVSYPLPGTKYYENVKQDLRHKANWTHSDDLALLFRNTYSPAFYRQLHRYVHKSYSRWLAVQKWKGLLRRSSPLNGRSLRGALSLFYYAPASLLEKWKLNRRQAAS